jgi:hypothetical protein
MKKLSVAPPNSLVLVMDIHSGLVPEEMGTNLVSATESCIAVGCRAECDGPTEIHFGNAQELSPSDLMVFDGDIATPRKKLALCSVLNRELLAADVAGELTHVRVFANDPIEPDRVFVVFD